MRSLIALLAGGLVGAALGHSQILCPTGTCAITGSWLGGGVVGGLMGLSLIGFVPVRLPDRTDDDPSADDADAGADERG